MDTLVKLPFYAKASLLLVGMYVFISILYIGQSIILPLIYATLFAVLISPAVNFLERKKINRAISITCVLFLAVLLVGGLLALLSSQTIRLCKAGPQLINKFQELLNQTITWASGYFNISADKINEWITNEKDELVNNGKAAIGTTLHTMGGFLAAAVLTPVYIFMILYYQSHLTEFVHKLFGAGHDNKVSEILHETKTIVKGYLVGLFIEFAIVSTMNSIGFLVLGFDYAILLGIAGGLLNAVPFIGGIICIVLFMLIALVTKAPVYILYVIGLHSVIQFIDNHYIVPKIIGSKVKLNALICLIAVVAGAALWGIPGMFLSIPLVAIIKLILDRIDSLKTWGFLLGTTIPVVAKMKFDFTIKGFFQGFTSNKS